MAAGIACQGMTDAANNFASQMIKDPTAVLAIRPFTCCYRGSPDGI
jgi:hypothetical protein